MSVLTKIYFDPQIGEEERHGCFEDSFLRKSVVSRIEPALGPRLVFDHTDVTIFAPS